MSAADVPAGEMALSSMPWSQEAEQAVLGAVLLDNGALDRVAEVLSEGDFFAAAHREVFVAMAALSTAHQPIDVLTVTQWLRDHGRAAPHGITTAYIHSLMGSVVSAAGVARYAQIVLQKALQRALIKAAHEAVQIATEDGASADERIDRAAALFDGLQRTSVRQEPRSVQELTMARLGHYDALANGQAPIAWSTGLESLDDVLNGGMQPGRVYVLAARPSMGKSSLALQIGLHQAQQHGVLYLSQEMPEEECIDRAVANLGWSDYGAMQRGRFGADGFARLTDGIQAINGRSMWIEDQPAMTLRDIRAKAMSLRRRGLKLMVVDYLQLCSGSGHGKTFSRNAELEEISRGIKALAKELQIAVILLSQLNREADKRAIPEPTLADLRDSGAIEQDADVVLGLWWVRDQSNSKVMALTVLKNRQGQRGRRIALEFFGQYQRWQPSTADVTPQGRQQRKSEGFEA